MRPFNKNPAENRGNQVATIFSEHEFGIVIALTSNPRQKCRKTPPQDRVAEHGVDVSSHGCWTLPRLSLHKICQSAVSTSAS